MGILIIFIIVFILLIFIIGLILRSILKEAKASKKKAHTLKEENPQDHKKEPQPLSKKEVKDSKKELKTPTKEIQDLTKEIKTPTKNIINTTEVSGYIQQNSVNDFLKIIKEKNGKEIILPIYQFKEVKVVNNKNVLIYIDHNGRTRRKVMDFDYDLDDINTKIIKKIPFHPNEIFKNS